MSCNPRLTDCDEHTCWRCGKCFRHCEEYAYNTVYWKPGTLVIHRSDAKRKDMLMRVLGYNQKTGECRTVYVSDSASNQFSVKIWHNDIKYLLDPAKFGIEGDSGDKNR